MQSELLPNPWNLPEVLHALVAPVYETFSFYELPRLNRAGFAGGSNS